MLKKKDRPSSDTTFFVWQLEPVKRLKDNEGRAMEGVALDERKL